MTALPVLWHAAPPVGSDNGAGLGANHQTGWTGVIARAMHLFATTTPAFW